MPILDGLLKLRSVAIDTQTLQNGWGGENIAFFSLEQYGSGEIASEESESPILRWLVEDPSFRNLILDELEMSRNTRTYLEQKHPALPRDWNGTPGDVDLLLVPEDPRESVAIEAKRFKLRIDNGKDHQGARPEKRMKQAIDQVLGLTSMGFHKVMLMILVPTDARGSTSMNSLCAGSKGKTLMRLVNLANELRLHQDVGVILVTIDQPTSKDFHDFVKVSACLVKSAMGRCQDSHLTERLVGALSHGWLPTVDQQRS